MKWICQICHIVRSVRESDLWSVRPKWEADLWGRSVRPWESDRPLTHTGRESDPRGYLTDFTAKRIASHGRVRSDRTASPAVRERPIGLPRPHRSASQITDLRVRSVRPCAWEAVMWSVWESEVRGRARPPTASQIWESDRPLTHTGRCSPILGAAWLISRLNALLRPGVRERPIGLSNLWGRGSPRCRSASHAHRAMQSDPRLNALLRPLIGSDRSHDKSERPWEAVRGRERPWEAVGLSLA